MEDHRKALAVASVSRKAAVAVGIEVRLEVGNPDVARRVIHPLLPPIANMASTNSTIDFVLFYLTRWDCLCFLRCMIENHQSC